MIGRRREPRKKNLRSLDIMLSTIFFSNGFLVLCSCIVCCFARYTITVNSPLRDGETLVSARERFELGFFNLSTEISDKRRYVGIWYYKSNPKIIVWVANRKDPVSDSTGVFVIGGDGTLNVSDGTGKSYWSSASKSIYQDLEATLMDSGNLILLHNQSQIWQSFEHPADTFLSGMKMGDGLTLTSWNSQVDPAEGNFSFKVDVKEGKQSFVIQNRHFPYWTSSAFGEFFSNNIKDEMPSAIYKFLLNSSNPAQSMSSKILPNDARIVMNYTGQIQYWRWYETQKLWSLYWWGPRDRCSVVNFCGSFGICNTNNKMPCKCLPGFNPSLPGNWKSYDFSGGCIRNSTECGKNEIFLNLKRMKVGYPDSSFSVPNRTECRNACLNGCQCLAYSYEETKNDRRRDGGSSNTYCSIWTKELSNLQEEYPDGGCELFVRAAVSSIESMDRNCEPCGTYVIPYPLSTGAKCGDPMYFNFVCNNATGKIRFKARTGTYNVTRINPSTRTFVIQTKDADNCNARNSEDEIMQLNESLSFNFKIINASRWCDTGVESYDFDISLKGVDEIEISWEPPPEPTCNSSADCVDWPYSTCNVTGAGTGRCLCNKNFQWDPLTLNCTQQGNGDNKQFGASSRKKRPFPLIVVVTTIAIVVVPSFIIVSVYIWRRKQAKRRERRANVERNAAILYGTEKRVKGLIDSEQFKEEDKKGIDVPFFDFDSLLVATDNFSDANKLGRGGFGPVYKGKFPGGQEIAIKRLSSVSGQGLEEFKTEVVLIARLQHRNLVRLVGYCIEGDEKILLYEYMPNKSLDSFVFDRNLSMFLNWEMRVNIILGVARGLLYLHQDSRLRIIHRDLKTSNILLDEEMNPKISDFGLARIFEGKQTEGSTNRVIGTYGYMSPEYALDGLFSVKSDVFSFGVVVLEILSGKRNTGYFKSEHALSLLGYAWRLWKEDKVLVLMDDTIGGSCNNSEFSKCVNVALLCVQEDPADRPTMSNVVVMLSSETATLPTPKQPAFVDRRDLSATASSSSKPDALFAVTSEGE